MVWVFSVFMVVTGVIATTKVPSFWRGAESYRTTMRAFTQLGEPMGSALAALAPLAGPGSILLGAFTLVAAAREVTAGAVQEALGVVGSILLLPVIATIILAFAIVLFGRPKRLIAPVLRDFDGIFRSARR